jgi:DNA polymerase I-like protein with 3'-5' exonuclease and polymerase domains
LYLPLKGFAVENETVLALAQVEREGIKVDIEGWLALEKINLEKYREKKKILDKYIISYFPNYTSGVDLFSNEETCGIDWQSPNQVIKLFRGLDICPKEKSKQTGKMDWTVGAKALFKLLTNENKEKFQNSETIEFKDKNDTQALILNFLVFKKYQMLTTTFGSKYLRWVHPITGKIHTNFRQYMNTGRMSSSSPNLQNVPAGKEWRKLFISEENEDMVAVDFESQEIRYLSVLANLQNMKDFFIKGNEIFGADFHAFSATNMMRVVKNDPTLLITKKTHPKERTISKTLTFGINYGKGSFSVSQELGIEESEAIKFIDGFLDGFPGLRENFAKRKKAATDNGWIEISPYTKKRYFFPEFKEMKDSETLARSYYTEEHNEKSKKINVALKGNLTKEQKADLLEQKQALKDELYAKHPELGPLWKRVMTLKGKLERRALNFGIQGGCSEMTKIALCLMVRAKIRVILIIHDEFLAVCKEPESEYVGTKIKELMVSAGARYSNDVKFTGDAATGKYWIH